MLFIDAPAISFLIAWFGSILNLILVFSGFITRIPNDLPKSEQLMRPVFISQLIFVGYMALTSIFFFLDVFGYTNFVKSPVFHVNYRVLSDTAFSQRLYSLAHASYTTGLLLFISYKRNTKWRVDETKIDALFFLKASVVLTALKFVFLFTPGLSQFSVKASDLAYISSIMSILYKSDTQKAQFYIIAILVFLFNLFQVLLSGWKEPIIFTLIIFGAYLYPRYKRLVLAFTIPLFLTVVFFLPSFNSAFRSQAWSEGVESGVAAQQALEVLQDGTVDVSMDNWDFLVNRSSEISMLNDYKNKVPSEIDYYGNEILIDAFRFILPRLFWPDKPDIEQHVMKRVYRVGVINQQMLVSAKPPLVVDAYLSGGILYIVLILFAFGMITSKISSLTEYLFCGYNLGTIWVFLGVFQIFNRGNCLEFLVNSIFWGIVFMYMILFVMKKLNIIVLNNEPN